ncbi:hypothetical protein HBH1_04473 [Herbaspirillum sp. BH-1]|uniref:Flp pilus assembly protein TadG n=1 Tax=Herbaspirillum frisingense TaxID=92645 RepID=A0ABU1PE93_9BURK|nr:MULTISPECIES: hypothetical protein [Herbaspirillum]MDR6584069.1 Flp pilus assembly protein TadG [Herbaspirillum frisingense]PLY57265.1 hypothetical protein HBH1_04473 [Herbaspirillum sp. BH-1]
MHAAELMLILLFLLLAYGGPFLLGYLYFRLRRARRGDVPVAAFGRTRSAALPVLCVVTLLLAFGLGHFRVLSYPGAIMLSMLLGAPVFFLSAALVVEARPSAPEEEG